MTLTDRQRDVLELIADGLNDQQIANRLEISRHTVRHHSAILKTTLGARDKAHAVAIGFRQGLLPLEDVIA